MRTTRGYLPLLRVAGLFSVVAGAIGSEAFMLWTGQRNPSRLLILLFAIWVLSPFAALIVAHTLSPRWSASTRAALYTVMLIVALSSLIIYGTIALGPPRPKPAAMFLVVPPASWLLMAIVVPAASLIRRSPRLPTGQVG